MKTIDLKNNYPKIIINILEELAIYCNNYLK